MKKTPKITIIGLGLIGGSLGLLLKEKLNGQVIGFSLHKKTLKKALKIGAIDKIANSLKESIEATEIVFIATPIPVITKILKKLVPFLKPNTIITDVGSVKEIVVEEAEKILPKSVSFIGGHPMAGKERKGIVHAKANLLKGCVWVLTPGKNIKKVDLNKLKRLIKKIGCQPLVVNPKWHDKAVAGISHLPAILASTLCNIQGKQKDWPKRQQLAAKGFRDISRLAANPPNLHTDFCLQNQKNIISLINKTTKELKEFQKTLKEKDRNKVFAFFQKAQKIRNDWFAKSRFALYQP